MNIQMRGNRPRSRTSAGFSLVEMMIAAAVSLFVIGALLTVAANSSSAGRSRERSAELQDAGRYALEQIKGDLLHAGFLGISTLFFPDQAFVFAVTNVCDSTTVGQISLRIWGANDSNPYNATCIPDANYSIGDVLVIRGLNPLPVTAPFSSTKAYYHSSYEKGGAFKGPGVATEIDCTGVSFLAPCFDYLINETVYYVSPYTTSAAESPLVPALYRMRLSDGPSMVAELVASGVENMQIRYGVFQTDMTVQYLAADSMAGTDWDAVKSVQIWLLMRSSVTDSGYVNNKTYTMGAQSITKNDGYPRLLLSTVVNLRN
jgi:Tfp pilus assembly protein PilW